MSLKNLILFQTRLYIRKKGFLKVKTVIKFIAFFIYTICLFWVKDMKVLLAIFATQILFMVLFRVLISGAIKTIWKLLPFIIFTVIIDLFVMEVMDAILIGIRLVMVCQMTYIFGKTTTAMQMAKAIKMLLYPLTWVGVKTNNIGIMVSLAITFIPIIKKEIENIRYSLKAKGFSMSFINQITHINYIMGPLFYSLIRKVSKIEDALKSKGYVEE